MKRHTGSPKLLSGAIENCTLSIYYQGDSDYVVGWQTYGILTNANNKKILKSEYTVLTSMDVYLLICYCRIKLLNNVIPHIHFHDSNKIKEIEWNTKHPH